MPDYYETSKLDSKISKQHLNYFKKKIMVLERNYIIEWRSLFAHTYFNWDIVTIIKDGTFRKQGDWKMHFVYLKNR